MHILTRRRLREYWEVDKQSYTSLDEWCRRMKKINPANLAELHQTFPHADLVGTCIVFNIGGNKYRLITNIDFQRQTIYIKSVLPHKEYDRNKWKVDC